MTEHEIFTAAIKLAGEERSAYLSEACGQNAELRVQIEALLKAHDETGGLQPKQADREFQSTQLFGCQPQPGLFIAGRYKLIETVGQGGMGTVWLAEQKEPVKRKVAIKLIRTGMDSAQVLARFDAERQALALMDHPNIARVFDGGMTEEGRPFLAMEFVKGMPLTDYCNEARLNLNERLKLFISVCQAVQHAHQKGIIHRDLKPSNILICLYDGKPVAKVIDFGLAKAMNHSLTEQTLHTALGMMVGTPLYMSPEQAEQNNLDVDTRTDIYSLGVILYELLTGSTPLEKQQLKVAAYNEILRLIKEVEPPKPSTRISSSASLANVAAQRSIEPNQLRKSLTGDLDWIVMKSLDKERSRRYETAYGLARDVERFLNDEAVEASPPSASYRLRKLLRKHRTAVGTATAFMVLLIAGAGISVRQAVRATKAEADANLSAQNASASEIRAVSALKQVTLERDATNAALAAESAQRELAERQFVAGILRPIGYGENPNQGELQSFVDWAALPNSRLKSKVLAVAFEKPELAFRVARRSDRTVQAAVGLSLVRRAQALEFLSAQQRQAQAAPQIRVAACWLALELGSSDLPALPEIIAWLGDPKTTNLSDFGDFRKFINQMTRHCDELSPEQVTSGWDALVALLKNSNFARHIDATGRGLEALAPRVSPEELTRGWDTLVALLEQAPGYYNPHAVEYSLAALAPRLNAEQVTRAVDSLITLLENSNYNVAREIAGSGLAALAPQLNPEQATRCWDALFSTMNKSTRAPLSSTSFKGTAPASNGLAAVAPRLSPEQVTRAVDEVVAALENPTDYDAQSAASILGKLIPRLSPEQMARAWDALVALLEKSEGYSDVDATAGEELVRLAPWLSPEHVTRGWDALLTLGEKSTDINVQNAAARGLIALAQRMSTEQATHGMDSLIPLLEKSTDREVLGSATRGLLWLAPRLSPEQATRGWDSLVALLERFFDPDVMDAAGWGLAALAPRLNPEQVTQGGDTLLSMIEKGTSIGYVNPAAVAGLAALAPRLSPEQVTRCCDALLAVLEKVPDDIVRAAAGNGLGAVAPQLTPDQVTRTWDALVALRNASGSSSVQEAAGYGLTALAPRLTREQVTRGSDALIGLLEKRFDKSLAKGLEVLVPRLSPERRVPAAEAIVSILSRSFNGAPAESLAVIVPHLDPASRDRISTAALTILLDLEVAFRDHYQEQDYDDYFFNPASRGISNAKSLAPLFRHPGCRGKQQEFMLQRFEELVLYSGSPVFLKPKAPEGAEQTHADSPATAPPPRQFHNLQDAAIWIQQNWPDFDLEACNSVTLREVD